MRIIAGRARAKRLNGPKTDAIRPTSDRVKQALFDILGQWMEDLEVLDLFAGTGALALEAISRGARSAVLVDSSREAIGLIQENASLLGFTEQVEVLSAPVARALELLGKRGSRFDLVFADPPYDARAVEELVRRIEAGSLLKDLGTLCIEHDKREKAPERGTRLLRVDERQFGDTCFSLYRLA